MRVGFAAALLLLLAGCSSTVRVDVGYPEGGVNPALLAAAKPRRVAIGPVTDRRRETRIGVEPEKGKALVTGRPVGDIVREALALELGKNGHAVAAEVADITLAADVEEFWLDIIAESTTAQYVGKVALAVTVTDSVTGHRLLQRRYVGIRRVQVEAKASSPAREVMDTALARAMRDIATDPELARAFGRVRSALAQ